MPRNREFSSSKEQEVPEADAWNKEGWRRALYYCLAASDYLPVRSFSCYQPSYTEATSK